MACSLHELPHRPLEDGKSIAVGMRKEKKLPAEEGAVDGYTFKVGRQEQHELVLISRSSHCVVCL